MNLALKVLLVWTVFCLLLNMWWSAAHPKGKWPNVVQGLLLWIFGPELVLALILIASAYGAVSAWGFFWEYMTMAQDQVIKNTEKLKGKI